MDIELDWLPAQARQAVIAAVARVDRADVPADAESLLGASKDMIETVAKVVLDELGVSYGSNESLPRLTKEAVAAIAEAGGLQGRASLEKLGGAANAVVHAVNELRNTDGTGHGRARRSDLRPEHARFVRNSAEAWCGWVLESLRRVIGHGGLEEALANIDGGMVFSRGRLGAYLTELDLEDRAERDQRRLGLAVSRRWTVGRTFMPLEDIIDPLVEGEAAFPPAFVEGLVEGLLLDRGGYLLMTPDDVRRAAGIARRLPADRAVQLFRSLADRIGDALPARSFDAEAQAAAVQAWRSVIDDRTAPSIEQAAPRIISRLEGLAQLESE